MIDWRRLRKVGLKCLNRGSLSATLWGSYPRAIFSQVSRNRRPVRRLRCFNIYRGPLYTQPWRTDILDLLHTYIKTFTTALSCICLGWGGLYCSKVRILHSVLACTCELNLAELRAWMFIRNRRYKE